MHLTQLRAFLLAATLGTLTAAAAALGTTQPSVSELVRRLEADYQIQLFIRAGRRLVLTAAGEELLPWARGVVEAADGADQALRAVHGLSGGVATLGVLKNARYYFLSDLAERFHAERPGVRIRLVGQNSVEVAEAVRSGELEAGLVVLPVLDEGLSVTPLLRDEVLWASASAARVARPIELSAIPDVPLILYDAHYGWEDPTRRQLIERAQREGIKLEPLIEVENVDAALSLVSRGVGETMVSKSIVRSEIMPPNVLTTSFAEPLNETIALIRRVNTTLSPATAELVRLARRMLLRVARPTEGD